MIKNEMVWTYDEEIDKGSSKSGYCKERRRLKRKRKTKK